MNVYLDLSKMAPKGRELSEDFKGTTVMLHKSGLGYKKISERIHICVNTVAFIVQKFKNTGVVRSDSRSGRPSLMMKRDARHIQQCLTKDRHRSASSLAQEAFFCFWQDCFRSDSLSKHDQHEPHGRVPRKKPLLNAKHKSSRFSFAKTYRDKERNFLSKILWSDGTKINLFGSYGIRRVWRRAGETYDERYIKPTVKHGGGSVIVWGCMSSARVGKLEFIEGKMDSRLY